MTRAEAIYCMKANSILHSEICEECPLYGDTGVDHCFEDGLDEAIKALEQEPCEDVISRQAVKEQMIKYGFSAPDMTVTEFVEGLPSVDTQPKTGRWEWIRYDSNPNIGNWHCSECRCVVVECVDRKSEGCGIPLYKYCPQCGCRMVEPQESEDEE